MIGDFMSVFWVAPIVLPLIGIVVVKVSAAKRKKKFEAAEVVRKAELAKEIQRIKDTAATAGRSVEISRLYRNSVNAIPASRAKPRAAPLPARKSESSSDSYSPAFIPTYSPPAESYSSPSRHHSFSSGGGGDYGGGGASGSWGSGSSSSSDSSSSSSSDSGSSSLGSD